MKTIGTICIFFGLIGFGTLALIAHNVIPSTVFTWAVMILGYSTAFFMIYLLIKDFENQYFKILLC